MAERKLVVDHLKLGYEGLFNAGELYSVISTWFFDKNYDWYEKMNQELITPDGKQVRIILEPWKNITDFYKLVFGVKLHLTDIKDVEVEHEGKTLKLSQGVVKVTFDGYVVSDRKKQWHSKPFWWFLSIIMEKYFFQDHYKKAETWMLSDVDDLHDKIKNYLNMFKYTYHA